MTAVLVAQAVALGLSAPGRGEPTRAGQLGSGPGSDIEKARKQLGVKLNQDLILPNPETNGASGLVASAPAAGGAGKYTPVSHALVDERGAPLAQQVDRIEGSVSNSTPWKPGDPIGNNSIPFAVGLNYLHQMLQMAVEVEHSVIPPYLTALYSIIPDGTDEVSTCAIL
jgi:hypothetical protein